jgi:hypothetical protein
MEIPAEHVLDGGMIQGQVGAEGMVLARRRREFFAVNYDGRAERRCRDNRLNGSAPPAVLRRSWDTTSAM